MKLTIIHPETDRRLIIRVSPDTAVSKITDAIVERLKLVRFDAHRLRQLTYSLVLVSVEGGEDTELDPDKEAKAQFQEGATLKLISIGKESTILSSEHGLATYKLSATWSVHDLEKLLHSLRASYIGLYAQNEILKDSKSEGHSYFHDGRLRDRHERIAQNISRSEELIIHKVSICSPGVLEVIGSLNPLETIRQYLKDRREATLEREKLTIEHEKEKSHRNALEQAKAVLEIESLKTKVATERAVLLRDAGFAQEEIQPYVKELIERPLEELVVYQNDSGLDCTQVRSLGTSGVELVEDAETSRLGLPAPRR